MRAGRLSFTGARAALAVLLLALVQGLSGAAAAAGGEICRTLSFTGTVAEVRDYADPADYHCYTLMLAGRATVSLRLTSDTALVSVRTPYAFPVSEQTSAIIQAHSGRHDILVGNPYRLPPSSYHLVVELQSYHPPANWAILTQGTSGISSQALSREGQTLLTSTCGQFRNGWHFNLEHHGPGLQHNDDQSEVLGVYFYGHPEGLRGHPIRMHYYGPEDTHVLSDVVGSAFLDDFAASALMVIVNSRSDIVATFDLAGAALLRAQIRSHCGT